MCLNNNMTSNKRDAHTVDAAIRQNDIILYKTLLVGHLRKISNHRQTLNTFASAEEKYVIAAALSTLRILGT